MEVLRLPLECAGLERHSSNFMVREALSPRPQTVLSSCYHPPGSCSCCHDFSAATVLSFTLPSLASSPYSSDSCFRTLMKSTALKVPVCVCVCVWRGHLS